MDHFLLCKHASVTSCEVLKSVVASKTATEAVIIARTGTYAVSQTEEAHVEIKSDAVLKRWCSRGGDGSRPGTVAS